jgi:hypothetical protein
MQLESKPGVSLPDILDCDSELDMCARVSSQVVEQHRLEMILRNRGRPGGTERGAFASGRVADVDQGTRGRL